MEFLYKLIFFGNGCLELVCVFTTSFIGALFASDSFAFKMNVLMKTLCTAPWGKLGIHQQYHDHDTMLGEQSKWQTESGGGVQRPVCVEEKWAEAKAGPSPATLPVLLLALPEKRETVKIHARQWKKTN